MGNTAIGNLFPAHIILIKLKGLGQDILWFLNIPDTALMVLVQLPVYMAFHVPLLTGGQLLSSLSKEALITNSFSFTGRVYKDMSGLIMVRQHIHQAPLWILQVLGLYHGIDTAITH